MTRLPGVGERLGTHPAIYTPTAGDTKANIRPPADAAWTNTDTHFRQ
jgi:hypothetical protein